MEWVRNFCHKMFCMIKMIKSHRFPNDLRHQTYEASVYVYIATAVMEYQSHRYTGKLSVQVGTPTYTITHWHSLWTAAECSIHHHFTCTLS